MCNFYKLLNSILSLYPHYYHYLFAKGHKECFVRVWPLNSANYIRTHFYYEAQSLIYEFYCPSLTQLSSLHISDMQTYPNKKFSVGLLTCSLSNCFSLSYSFTSSSLFFLYKEFFRVVSFST